MRWAENAVLRVGHRGAPHLAPANTMASFRAAFAAGCDWVECDARASSDGVVVLSHDDAVTHRDGTVVRIAEQTADELAALDLGRGEGVPTLEELVAWAAGRVGLMADVKAQGIEETLGDALSPLPLECKIVAGADDAMRGRFRALFPDLPLSLSLGPYDAAELERRWHIIETEAVTLHFSLLTHARVEALRKRRIRVFAWTVDEADTMRGLLDMGVDGIISNRADLLARLRTDPYGGESP